MPSTRSTAGSRTAQRVRVRAKVAPPSDCATTSASACAARCGRQTGKQVELEEGVDPSLLGGVVASVGGMVFDGSLRTQLAQLHGSLTK